MRLIPRLSIIVFGFVCLLKGISGVILDNQGCKARISKLLFGRLITSLKAPSVLLWFVSRKFTGKSRVFLISVFFPPKSKLYVISSSVKASNVKVLICYAFRSFFLFFNEKSENLESLLPGNCWNPEKLRYRSNFSLIEISAICFDIGLHRLVTTAVPSNSLFIFSSLFQTDSRCFVCECELFCQISVKFCVGK
jgi:hypothetical protein